MSRIANFKNTNTGPLFVSAYTPISSGVQIASTSAASRFQPQDFGATYARFAFIQVLTDDANVVVSIGISESIEDPASGSYRVGRTFGMPYLQLPAVLESEIRIMADPVAGVTCAYTLNFID